MYGAMGEPAHGGSEAGPLVYRSELTLESEAMSGVACELMSVEVVSVPRGFGVDPVGVNSVPGVVTPWRAGCVLAATQTHRHARTRKSSPNPEAPVLD